MSQSDNKHQLYPEIEPYHTGYMQVSDIHQVFFEQVGNPNGSPILFVHGGGGISCNARDRRFFDPTHYRIILLDRRGLGRSKPFGEIQDNDTWKVVDDYEKLRKFLEIEKWIIFGGSLGSAISLIYTQLYPDRVIGLILRGIVLGQRKELQWVYNKGACYILPEYYEEYRNAIPEAERDDLIAAYWKRINSDDSQIRMKFAKQWMKWAFALSVMHDHEVNINMNISDEIQYLIARYDKFEISKKIHAYFYYCSNYVSNLKLFSPDQDDYILANVEKIRHIRCIIIHGRYDIICPPQRAWDLHKKWPEADLRIICNAGHMQEDLPMTSALVAATKEFQKIN